MDIAYFVRPGDDNEELRYSLRPLKNIPHGKVYIAGYCPTWLQDVEHIPVPQGSNKNVNTTDNLYAIAKEKGVSEQFILMNDDFFIMKPMRSIPRMNRGPIEDVLDQYREINSGYFKGMEQTYEYMKSLGLEDILSYELHVPMIMQKDNVIEMFIRYRTDQPKIKPLHKRSLYGNMFNYGGVSMKDVKVYANDQEFDKDSDFLSSQDGAFENGKIGEFIRSKFPEKSPYEK